MWTDPGSNPNVTSEHEGRFFLDAYLCACARPSWRRSQHEREPRQSMSCTSCIRMYAALYSATNVAAVTAGGRISRTVARVARRDYSSLLQLQPLQFSVFKYMMTTLTPMMICTTPEKNCFKKNKTYRPSGTITTKCYYYYE